MKESIPRNTAELAAATGTDFFFRVPHAMPWLSSASVLVREKEGAWQNAIGYDLGNTGYGSPYEGHYPTREIAGRAGLSLLADALCRRIGKESRPTEHHRASQLAALVNEAATPSQPLLSLF